MARAVFPTAVGPTNQLSRKFSGSTKDQSNSLEVLNDKYNVHYWNDWEVGDTGTIGERYGAVVKKHDIINKLLKQLEANPWNRRNIISLWDYQAFEETDGLLPCAFQTHV